VASIGPGTSRALAAHGIAADIVAERSVGEGLVQALADVPVTHALVARARGGRDVLPDALRERGADVDVLDLYETVAEPLDVETVAAVRAADYVTFTSSSTVRNLLQAIGAQPASAAGEHEPGIFSSQTRIVSIGPVTSETLTEHGLPIDVEATQHDVEGVLEALLADAATEAR
ncbi:MAG TPA: uroporphyrinogen-III synthase, partial [Solirubrobacteraceae bacterium]